MTREEYGQAYQKGFNLTFRFLVSRGVYRDAAQETAQAAWAKGWEHLHQLRKPAMIFQWMNTIALNLHRSDRRREPVWEDLPEIATSPRVDLARIDAQKILTNCRNSDRTVLDMHYLQEFKIQEIADQQGCSETAIRIRLCRARRSAHQVMQAKTAECRKAA